MSHNEWEELCDDEFELEERVGLLRIESVAISGDEASIAWEEITNDGAYGRSVSGASDYPVELYQLYKSMQDYIPETLRIVMEGDDYNTVTISRIGFKLKSSIEYARVSAALCINGSKEIKITMPETALYNSGRDPELSKTLKSFTKEETEILEKICLEAKYYTLGKRRPERAHLFNRGEE